MDRAQHDGRPAEYRWRSLLNVVDQIAKLSQDSAKPVEICWGALNSPTDLSR